MSSAFGATIAVGGSLLFTYSWIERRLNQRSCPWCGYRVSANALEPRCSRCYRAVSESEWRRRRLRRPAARPAVELDGWHANDVDPQHAKLTGEQDGKPAGEQRGIGYWLARWPTLVLVLVPMLIVVGDAALVIGHRTGSITDRAIRLVKESSSPIESFSVQQYLNGDLYHRMDRGRGRGANVTIRGWTATRNSTAGGRVAVQFAYSEDGVQHVARWLVEVSEGKVVPQNRDAAILSWPE